MSKIITHQHTDNEIRLMSSWAYQISSGRPTRANMRFVRKTLHLLKIHPQLRDKNCTNEQLQIVVDSFKKIKKDTSVELVRIFISTILTRVRKDFKKWLKSKNMDKNKVSKLWYYKEALFLCEDLMTSQNELSLSDVSLSPPIISEVFSFDEKTSLRTYTDEITMKAKEIQNNKLPDDNVLADIISNVLQESSKEYGPFRLYLTTKLNNLPNNQAFFCKTMINKAIEYGIQGKLCKTSQLICVKL